MACLSRPSYPKKVPLNRSHFAYKRCIPFTNLASGIQNWRFAFKYAVFNLQTSISPYKLAPQITTQPIDVSKSSKSGKTIYSFTDEEKDRTVRVATDLKLDLFKKWLKESIAHCGK